MRKLCCLIKNFFSNTKAFFFQNELKIFSILCLVYWALLLCITKFIFAIIIFYWSGTLFSFVFILNVMKVPVFQLNLSLIFVAKVFLMLQTENIVFFLGLCMLIFFSLTFLYFYLENNFFVLTLKKRFLKFKKVSPASVITTETEFEYFGAVSILGSCALSVLFSLRFFYKKDLFVVYESLSFQDQHLITITLISVFFIVAVGGILDFFFTKNCNNSTPDKHYYIAKGECLFRIVSGGFFSFFFFDYLSRLSETPSTLGISCYRIYFGVGYTWNSVADFTLAEEYTQLSRGCTPPLLKTMEVDVLTTSNRLTLLKLLDSEQFLAFSNVMSQKKSVEELLQFRQEQHAYFRAFIKHMDSGLYDK